VFKVPLALQACRVFKAPPVTLARKVCRVFKVPSALQVRRVFRVLLVTLAPQVRRACKDLLDQPEIPAHKGFKGLPVRQVPWVCREFKAAPGT